MKRRNGRLGVEIARDRAFWGGRGTCRVRPIKVNAGLWQKELGAGSGVVRSGEYVGEVRFAGFSMGDRGRSAALIGEKGHLGGFGVRPVQVVGRRS